MTDLAIVRTVRTMVAVGAVLALIGTAIDFTAGHAEYWYESYAALLTVYAIGLAVFVWLAIARQPRNAAVWATATAALAGLGVLAFALAPFLADAVPSEMRYPNYIPADHPALAARALSVGEVATTVAVFVPFTFGLLLFPEGELPTRRWRVAAWIAGAAVASQCAAYVVGLRPNATAVPEDSPALGIAQLATLAAVVLGVVALVIRSRSASGPQRQQYKWVMWGAAVGSAALIAGIALTNRDDPTLPKAVATGGFGVMVAGYAVALGRYRLYDVDVVISRTIVYGLLASTITAAYVAGVVVSSHLLGGSDEPGIVPAIAATAGVGMLFGPLRRRLQRLADRLVHGKRATPHEVLSEFSKRFSTDDAQLLEHAARLLVEGTAAGRVEVWTNTGDRDVRVAEWPQAEIANAEVTHVGIAHEGAHLGALRLLVPAGRRLVEQDRRLAEQVASGIGLALRNQALTDSLERRVAELRRSRRRLVEVQDDTRRRLERDLHDGAQQQLVALRVKLGLARSIAIKEGAAGTVASVDRLAADGDVAIDIVRTFARGLHPPLLEAEGLEAAITAEARRMPVLVDLRVERIGRFDPQIETTVNLCVAEALENVAAHARAQHASVTLVRDDGGIRFDVHDDGVGFDAASLPTGCRLRSLADRMDALGGTLAISSSSGSGTSVLGTIPITDEVAR